VQSEFEFREHRQYASMPTGNGALFCSPGERGLDEERCTETGMRHGFTFSLLRSPAASVFPLILITSRFHRLELK
jgi:hypothetical protein